LRGSRGDAIGEAAADAWGKFGTALYAEAWKDTNLDPLEQLHRFFEIMDGFTRDEANPCTCVVGIMSQEMALSHPALRDCCAKHLHDWTNNTARLLAAAKAKYPPVHDFDEHRVAWFLNSLWQGSMLIAKTCQSPAMIRANLSMARECLDRLFGAPLSPPSSLQTASPS
jgi:TetR/AcrR family transcriptional repressor of nem operon